MARINTNSPSTDTLRLRAVAQAAVNQAQANMALAAENFRQGVIDFDEWFDIMEREIVNSQAAVTVLAHGGTDAISNRAWVRAAENAQRQLDFFASFAADVAAGRVSDAQLLQRSGMYAQSARASYENERALVEAETTGATLAARIRGDADSCQDCIDWSEDNLGWIPLEEMLADYPIGASRCHTRCYCSIIVKGEGQ